MANIPYLPIGKSVKSDKIVPIMSIIGSAVKRLGSFTAADGWDLHVNESEYLDFPGLNGAGKTSLALCPAITVGSTAGPFALSRINI